MTKNHEVDATGNLSRGGWEFPWRSLIPAPQAAGKSAAAGSRCSERPRGLEFSLAGELKRCQESASLSAKERGREALRKKTDL